MDKFTNIVGRCTLALIAIILLSAQTEVQMNGADSSENVRRVLVDSSGRLVTSATGGLGAHGACTNTTMNVGTTGTACPASPRSDRNSILIQLIQSGETLRITSDGATTASATQGVEVSSGGSYTDDLLGSVSANCRCSAATCSVMIVECP